MTSVSWMRTTVTVLGLLVAVALAPADQEPSSQPASRPASQPASQPVASQPAPSHLERLNDLVGVIEGQNSPEVRQTVTRELLLQGWPETSTRLTAILSGPNAAAKVAVATALVGLPQFLDPGYIDPLVTMLGDADESVRTAAAGALAAYRDNGVIPRLRALVADVNRPRELRLAAIGALGLMTQRSAIEGLATALADSDPLVAAAALRALELATAMDFAGDVAAARAWWDQSAAQSEDQWQQQQLERLVRRARETRRRLETVEARLVKALEEGFARAPENERVALLATYLADGSVSIRLLGLRLTQMLLAEGKALPLDLPQELRDQIRQLMHSSDPTIQAPAVRTVASFRAAEDANGFLELLTTAHNPDVIQALANGLGYVGSAHAVKPLLAVLNHTSEACVTEVVTALGRLAERGMLDAQDQPAVVDALLGVFEKTTSAQVALRERVLWAMGIIKDPRFGPAFARSLDRGEAVAVRQAAARGIAALNDPQWADALADAVSDPDAAVRRTAIETLAVLGSTDKHLEALWRRLTPAEENVEAIRQAVAQAIVELLVKRPADQVESWLARLPRNGPEHTARMAALLERLVQRAQDSDPNAHDRLGVILARLAALQLELGQTDVAIETYRASLAELHEAKSGAATRIALDLLRIALANNRYDEVIAQALTGGNPGPSGDAMWQVISAELESRLRPETVTEALAMLDALEAHPPGTLPREGLARLRARAVELKDEVPPTQPVPVSQPASAPANP